MNSLRSHAQQLKLKCRKDKNKIEHLGQDLFNLLTSADRGVRKVKNPEEHTHHWSKEEKDLYVETLDKSGKDWVKLQEQFGKRTLISLKVHFQELRR